MSLPAPSVSRRERPAKRALTRQGIVAAAVEILRSEGLAGLTMRRLAQSLDTGAASLYVYVRNTAELHAAVLDELLSGVDLAPVDADGNWHERLRRVLASYTVVLFAHPGLADSAMTARPCGPHALDLWEALLALLHEGGVPDDRAAWGVDLLLQIATATAAEHGARARAVDPGDEQDAVETAIRGASPDSHPRVAALAVELLSGEGADRLDWAFSVLIDGFQHTPRPAVADGAEPVVPPRKS